MWVTKEVKTAISKKKRAFFSGDKDKIKAAQKELKAIIKQGKSKYKERVEGQMCNSNTRGLWNGMKNITGYGTSKLSLSGSGIDVNEANQFFSRFDELDFSFSYDCILSSLAQSSPEDCSPPVLINVEEVRLQLKHLKVNKAAGPDGVLSRTLKVCADQLCSVLH